MKIAEIKINKEIMKQRKCFGTEEYKLTYNERERILDIIKRKLDSLKSNAGSKGLLNELIQKINPNHMNNMQCKEVRWKMEKIVFKEQIVPCKCPYCAREFAIVKDMDTEISPKLPTKLDKVDVVKKPVKVKAKRNFSHWTAEDDDAIRSMTAQGLKTKQMAAKIGRTISAIYVRKGILGVAKNLHTSQKLEVQGLENPHSEAQELLANC